VGTASIHGRDGTTVWDSGSGSAAAWDTARGWGGVFAYELRLYLAKLVAKTRVAHAQLRAQARKKSGASWALNCA